jgi:hypothetical protein
MKKVFLVLALVAVYGISVSAASLNVVSSEVNQIVLAIDNVEDDKKAAETTEATAAKSEAKAEGCATAKTAAAGAGCGAEKTAAAGAGGCGAEKTASSE